MAVALTAAVVGGIAGGYVDFQASWDVNVGYLMFGIRTIVFLVAVVAVILWWRGQARAGLLALASFALLLGSLVGGWVAPSANPPVWSQGTVRLEFGDPVNAVVEGPSECLSGPDFVTIGSPEARDLDLALGPVAGERVYVSLGLRTDEPMSGDLPFSAQRDLFIGSGSASLVEHAWAYDPEAQGQTLHANGVPQGGAATFSAISPSSDYARSAGGGLGEAAPFALSGRIEWTCEPPRGVPTVREGTWFT